MKLCVAQTRPVTGDIQANIAKHRQLIELATTQGIELIVFPELSLTSYEPELAEALATSPDDQRLDVFQTLSDAGKLIIGLGLPIRQAGGTSIGMVLFQPHKARSLYSKKYLHADEEPFFICGQSSVGLLGGEAGVALAICYELSVARHAEDAVQNGAKVYLASVAKSVSGVEQALWRLADIASTYSMTVLMSNAIGPAEDYECGGKSSIWNSEGVLIGQLDDQHEGLLVIDTKTQEVTQHQLQLAYS